MNRCVETLVRVEPKTAHALVVPRGATLRIVDLEGGQAADVVAFVRGNVTEHFAQNTTRTNNWKTYVSAGDRLWSNRNTAMLTITRDTVGTHDVLFPCCSRYVYEHLLAGPSQDGCVELLAEQLRAFDVPRDTITDPLNVFMCTAEDARGQPMIGPPTSAAGDVLEMRAEVDCVVGISACPDDRSMCNGSRCTAIGVEVIPSP